MPRIGEYVNALSKLLGLRKNAEPDTIPKLDNAIDGVLAKMRTVCKIKYNRGARYCIRCHEGVCEPCHHYCAKCEAEIAAKKANAKKRREEADVRREVKAKARQEREAKRSKFSALVDFAKTNNISDIVSKRSGG